MVRGRRPRAATTAVVTTNFSLPHESSLSQQTTINETSISTQNPSTTYNDHNIAQNKILSEDQNCYASPKRKESKIDEKTTASNVHTKTRSSARSNTHHLTTRSHINGAHSNSNRIKNVTSTLNHHHSHHNHHNHHHHHHHHHHHLHNHQQQQELDQQNQKPITKYFNSVDQIQKEQQQLHQTNYNLHPYNGVITHTNEFNSNNEIIIENDNINIQLIDDNVPENDYDDEEEDFEEDTSDDSNEILNGSMNCSGIRNNNLNEQQQQILTNNIKNEKILPIPVLTQQHKQHETNMMETASSKNNLFLQEPVLSLNIDKSPNQPSSIKINKTLEVEPIFSAIVNNNNSNNLNCNSICLNGFNKIVTLKSSPKRSISSDTETNAVLNNSNNKIDNNNSNYNNNINLFDNNSNDSGVIIDQNNSSISCNNQKPYDNVQINLKRDELSPSKRRKPTTPHRILCPSPVKHPLVEKSSLISCVERTPININKINTTATNHGVVVNGAQKRNPKSRRRLNASQSENSSITLPQTGKKAVNEEKLKKNNKQQQKLILNYAKTPTAQQNSNNNVKNNQPKTFTNSLSPTRQNENDIVQNQSILNGGIIPKLEKNDTIIITANQMKPPQIKPTYQPTKTRQESITDCFPVRRSVRKTKTAVKEEMMRTLEKAILENREEGLMVVKEFEGKGRGIVTTRKFLRGEFVIEYIGDLIDMNEANEREYKYSLDENTGCYMYYFKHKNQQYCIDATAESGKLGRLVNHSRNGNLMTKVVVVKSKPHLVLLAKDDIEEGVELTYDYGDRSKEALQHHPWIAL